MKRLGAVTVLGILLVTAVRASAQRAAALPTAAAWGPEHVSRSIARDTNPSRAPFTLVSRIPKPLAPVASAVIPGVGQLMLKQDRFVAYAAVEAFVLFQYAKDVHESNVQQSQSRDLALRVARKGFVDSSNAPVGPWDYYETLEHYVQSGKYTLTSGSIVPDTTRGSYNAYVWATARANHWPNPDQPPPVGSPAYTAAIEEYASKAVPAQFAWSWINAELEQNLYVAQINKRNDAFRHATTDLSIILANHILSMVDAFATIRVQAVEAGDHRLGITTSIPLPRLP